MYKSLTALAFSVILAACSGAAPPSSPPEWSQPPALATTGFLTAYAEEEINLTVPQLRTFLRKQPLIRFLEPTESISNPVATEIIRGNWPEPEATRRVKLADGHYIIERVIENKPDFFKYQIFIFTNDAARGVEQIVGEQRFVSMDSGSRFEWTYNVLPKNFLTRQFLRGNLPEIESYLSGGLSRFAAAANAGGSK